MWMDSPITPAATNSNWWVTAIAGAVTAVLTALGFKMQSSPDSGDKDKDALDKRLIVIETRLQTQGDILTAHTTILSRLDRMENTIMSTRDCLIRVAAELKVEGPK